MDIMMNPYAGMNSYTGMNATQRMNQFSQPQSLIKVNGVGGASAYQMAPNSTVALFDNNDDIMYVKNTDGAGFPSIRVFRFEEISPTSPNSNDYVKKDEFEQFKKEMMEVIAYGKQSISETNENTKK